MIASEGAAHAAQLAVSPSLASSPAGCSQIPWQPVTLRSRNAKQVAMSLPQGAPADDQAPSPESTHWLAIAVTPFCVSLIVGAELLPVGLLTVMANDLGVSKGAAGQSISATALVAVFSGLFITRVIGNWDHKYVSIAFSCLLLVASVLVAVAPNYQTMIAGRLLLGVPLGGFGLVPVGGSNWVAVTFGKDAELAGGLQVASIQLANAAGAGMSGLMLNLAGPRAPLYAATTLLFITVAIVSRAVT